MYSPQNPISPSRFFGCYFFLIISIALPPLSMLAVPHFVAVHVQVLRRWRFLRHSRDAYITHQNLVELGSLARGGR